MFPLLLLPYCRNIPSHNYMWYMLTYITYWLKIHVRRSHLLPSGKDSDLLSRCRAPKNECKILIKTVSWLVLLVRNFHMFHTHTYSSRLEIKLSESVCLIGPWKYYYRPVTSISSHTQLELCQSTSATIKMSFNLVRTADFFYSFLGLTRSLYSHHHSSLYKIIIFIDTNNWDYVENKNWSVKLLSLLNIFFSLFNNQATFNFYVSLVSVIKY